MLKTVYKQYKYQQIKNNNNKDVHAIKDGKGITNSLSF